MSKLDNMLGSIKAQELRIEKFYLDRITHLEEENTSLYQELVTSRNIIKACVKVISEMKFKNFEGRKK